MICTQLLAFDGLLGVPFFICIAQVVPEGPAKISLNFSFCCSTASVLLCEVFFHDFFSLSLFNEMTKFWTDPQLVLLNSTLFVRGEILYRCCS